MSTSGMNAVNEIVDVKAGNTDPFPPLRLKHQQVKKRDGFSEFNGCF